MLDRTTFAESQRSLIERLHARAVAERPVVAGRVSSDALGDALWRSASHRFGSEAPTPADLAAYLDSLHAGDLALARACADGDELAWEHFVTEMRPALYAAARVITGREDAGRELADSIYAELYGLERGVASRGAGERRSLFRYFHGRSRLTTWLRAILAQRHVDALRAGRRFESLDHLQGAEPDRATWRSDGPSSSSDPDRSRYLPLVQAALGVALRELDDRERLRLTCYYAQQMTLAEVGRLLGEHEATVSRKLDRTRRRIRQAVERELTETRGLTADEIALCYQYAVEEAPVDLKELLEGKVGG